LDGGSDSANDMFMLSSGLGTERRSYASDFGNSRHLWLWDYPSMKAALERHGFASVRRCAFNDSADPMFLQVEQKGRFVHEAIEARKPD
jgi:hypothetical protein